MSRRPAPDTGRRGLGSPLRGRWGTSGATLALALLVTAWSVACARGEVDGEKGAVSGTSFPRLHGAGSTAAEPGADEAGLGAGTTTGSVTVDVTSLPTPVPTPTSGPEPPPPPLPPMPDTAPVVTDRELPGFPVPLVPAQPGTVVAVVGDSLTWSASAELRAWVMGSGVGQVRVASVPGARIDDMSALVAAAARADVVVVALGTNDLRRLPDDARTDDAIVSDTVAATRRALALASPAPCVVWVNVSAVNPSTGLDGRADAFDAVLPSLVASVGPKGRVVDWRATSAGHTDWFTWDGLHLTRSGQSGFAQAIGSVAHSCPRP